MQMIKGYRTFIFAAIVAVLGALQTLDWTQVLNEDTAGLVLIAIGGLIAALRTFTNTSPGKPE